MNERKRELFEALARTREKTLWLLDFVPDEFLKVRVHSFYSPVGWHFGHVGRTEEYWVSHKALGRPVIDDHLSFLFADLPDNPKDNRVHLPSRDQILEYLSLTRARTLEDLTTADFDNDNPFLNQGYAWDFAVQHECQHQETICEMLQLIQKAELGSGRNQERGTRNEVSIEKNRVNEPGPTIVDESWSVHRSPFTVHDSKLQNECAFGSDFVEVPAGSFVMGTSARCTYDNEKQPHPVDVQPFKLSRNLVTASQWMEFMAGGGYQNPTLWSSEGWGWRCTEDAVAPEYWTSTPEGWKYIGPQGLRDIHPQEPASSISRYEAEAFCQWSGKRMPTEEEWEYVASLKGGQFVWGNEPPTCETAVFGISSWGPQPVGSKPAGANPLDVQDLTGNVWEWTSSKFLPYLGFEAFPYNGYSKDHMKGEHYVCRGGSWATAAPILRCTFRNWYIPSYRQGFLGLRCADD